MLRHLKRVFVQFNPQDPKSKSARELLHRVTNDLARRSNANCEVDYKADDDMKLGTSIVELQFVDDEKKCVAVADLRVEDVLKLIDQKAKEMELVSVLKEVGYNPWEPDNRIITRDVQRLDYHMTRERVKYLQRVQRRKAAEQSEHGKPL